MHKCKCNLAQEGMDKLDACILYCANHTFAPKYTGDPFRYCPWCGDKLRETEKNKYKEKIRKAIRMYIRNKCSVEIYRTDETGEYVWAVRVAKTDFWLTAFKKLSISKKFCAEFDLPFKVILGDEYEQT